MLSAILFESMLPEAGITKVKRVCTTYFLHLAQQHDCKRTAMYDCDSDLACLQQQHAVLLEDSTQAVR